jgi:hypothetical protein
MADTTLEQVEELVAKLSLKDQQALAEHLILQLKKKSDSNELRPFALCKGQFVVPDDFDMPLPEDIITAFEGS